MKRAVSDSHPARVDEELLIARIMARHPQAERDLYDAHVERVYRLAYRMARDVEVARDLTQDVFVRVFERIKHFRGESGLGTWVHAVAISVVLNGLRHRRVREGREAPLETESQVAVVGKTSDPDLRERLHQSIDALPEEYRVVFVMREIEGFSHEEIAAGLGVTAAAVRVRFHRAKEKLRAALQPFAEDMAT